MHVQSCFFAKVKPITFLPFSLPSPSSLLKLPIVLIQKFCYHGNMTSLFGSLFRVEVDSPAASTMLSRQHLNGQRTLILLSQSRHSFVTPHLRATYPAHFHLIDAMCLTMSFTSSAVTSFLVWPLLSQIYGQYLPLHCPLRRSQPVPYALRVFLILLLL